MDIETKCFGSHFIIFMSAHDDFTEIFESRFRARPLFIETEVLQILKNRENVAVYVNKLRNLKRT